MQQDVNWTMERLGRPCSITLQMARLLALTVTGERMPASGDLERVGGVGWEASKAGWEKWSRRNVLPLVSLRWEKKGQIIAHKTRWLAAESVRE